MNQILGIDLDALRLFLWQIPPILVVAYGSWQALKLLLRRCCLLHVVEAVAIMMIAVSLASFWNMKIRPRDTFTMSKAQIEFCEEHGIPTQVIQEMNENGSRNVEEVESMMSYLENKYGEQYTYLSYTPSRFFGKAVFVAYPDGGTAVDAVTVTGKNGVFTDNHAWTVVRNILTNSTENYAKQVVPTEELTVIAMNGDTSMENVRRSMSIEDIAGRCKGSLLIAVSGDYSDAQMETYAQKIGNWLKSYEIYGTHQLVRFDSASILEDITMRNYENLLLKNESVNIVSVQTNQSGVKIKS